MRLLLHILWILFGVVGALAMLVFVGTRYANPALTQIQHLYAYWQVGAVALVAVALCLVTMRAWQKRRDAQP